MVLGVIHLLLLGGWELLFSTLEIFHQWQTAAFYYVSSARLPHNSLLDSVLGRTFLILPSPFAGRPKKGSFLSDDFVAYFLRPTIGNISRFSKKKKHALLMEEMKILLPVWI